MSRIGLFTYSTKPRGSVVHAACLAEALGQAQHEVTLFALSRGQPGFFRELGCALELFPSSEAPMELDALIRQRIGEFVRGLEALDPALGILHAQDCLAANALLQARASGQLALSNSPLVRTVHHVERFESPYLLECQRRSILEADLLLSVSRATQQAVRAEFGRESQLVCNGVDTGRFAPVAPEKKRALRGRLGICAQDFLVLSVGGVEARKNSLRCLEAFARLALEQPRALWLVVGGASILDHREFQEAFEARLAQLPLSTRERVRRHGTLSDGELLEAYQAADALCCPSEQEGWGLCVLEAMAAALPVVVSDRPPFTEYVSEQCGLFVDPGDVQAVARALVRLATEPDTRSRLGAAGRRIAERFSWARSAALHAEAYQRALRRTPP
jgi:glycosyltransferase-like protein